MTELPTAPFRYDPADDLLAVDPDPTYQELLARHQVYQDPADRFWALSRYADVAAAFADSARFTSRHGVAYEGSGDSPSLLEMDPPTHTGYRRVVARFFTPRRVAALAPSARAIARAAVAELGATFDLVRDFAARLPVALAGELLGVDRRHVAELAGWIDQVLTCDGDHAGAALALLTDVVRRLLADRRAHPEDDLASALVGATIDGCPLPWSDQVMICQMILLGGQEPVSTLIGAAAGLLDRDRLPGSVFRPGEPLPDGLVDEVARVVSPTQYMLRTATTDVRVGDTVIPAGAQVVLLIAAANQDPRRFTEPGRFDWQRPAGRSLAFGWGPHACLGQWLGRLLVGVALEELYRARPALVVRHWQLDWRRSGNVRRLHAAPAGG